MNKNDDAPGPPPASPPKSSVSPDRGSIGPLAETPQGHDPTLKWCIPDLRRQRELASPPANQPPVSEPADENKAKTPKASSLPEAPAEGAITGALPEAIHESTLDTSAPRGESFEILVADGSAEGAEAEPPGTPEEMEAVTPPPVREAPAAAPPPRREMEAVTPPPVPQALAKSPPPRREMETVTPPPVPQALAKSPPPRREMEAVTPPPVPAALAVTPPPVREALAVSPPARRETEAVTPPRRPEAVAATPPPGPEVVAATPAPKPEPIAATPPPKPEAVTPLPLFEPAPSPRPVAQSELGAKPSPGVSPSASQVVAATGALPEAPIRMAETAEVGEGEFEVVEAADTPSRPSSVVPTPPPVPGIAGSTAAMSQSAGRESPTTTGVSVGGGTASASVSEVPPLPEALSRRPLKKRLKPWFEEVFDEDYLRTLPFMTAQQTLRETAFIKEALSPPAEGEVLDIGCGYGRHAIEFGQRGFRVTGLDLSLPLLIRAADEAQRRSLSVNFVHADMREMTYDSQFDAAYCVLTSFGYFDEETNLRVATSVCRAIKPGGRFLVDTINRDYIVSDLPSRIWWEGDGCVVLEEVDFDFHTSRVLIRRSIVFGDGRQVENEISIRAYSLHELGRVLRRAGFQVLEVSGSLANKEPFLGAASRHVVLVCERPLT